MLQDQFYKQILEQSDDLIWMVDSSFHLIYANSAYLSLMKEVTGEEKKLNEPIFVNGFGEGYTQKWKAYYTNALKGEHFDLEEHFYHQKTKEFRYSRVTFKPILGDEQEVVAVACQSRDISSSAKHKSSANQMMDASLDVFCSISEAGYFTYVSAAATRLWGYTPAELVGTAYVDLLVTEDIPKTIEVATAILSGQNFTTFENRYQKKDGGIAYNLWSARWDDTSKLIYCVARDGKEKLEREAQISQSEQRFKALVQEGDDLIGILDSAGNYTYVSPSSTSILGISPEEFIGRSAFEFIHPDDVERTMAGLQKLANENRVVVEPFRFQNKFKEWLWVETVLTNMLDNPAVNGIVANSRDITSKVEEEHRRKLLESVITNTSDAVVITEAESVGYSGPKIIYVNEAFTKMTGYTAEEVIGKTPSILHGPNSDIKELEKLGKALQNWESHETTTIHYKKNGEEFWINFTVTPVADEKGTVTHWVAIERDVTEQKNKELEVELEAGISSIFNLENDLIKSTEELCKTIGKFGKFDWVELWTINLEESHMKLLSHYVESPEDEVFFDKTSGIKVLQKMEGLPGKVWFEKTQLFWSDIEKSMRLGRKEEAQKIGLKSVGGIPLFSKNEIIGVLTIGSKSNERHLKKYVGIFERFENFIGSKLKRKMLENDLNNLFNAIPDLVSVSDFQGRFLSINEAGCKLMGYSEEEILHHSFEEFIHPDDLIIAFQELKKLNEGQATLRFEIRFITKSGHIIWLSWYCNSVVNEGLIYSTAKNISEEKKLKELNRQSSQLAKIGSWEVDMVNQTVYWTDEVHQMHETDPRSFVPDLAIGINFYREDFRGMVQERIERSITNGEPFDFEAVLVTAKKKELWVRAIGNAEFLNNQCTRIFGSFQDIHKRKEDEIALQKSESKFRTIFEIASLGIIQVDPSSGQIIFANSYYETITGYSVDELLNMNFLEVTHPDDREKDWELFNKASSGEQEYRNEKRYVKKDGSIVWVRIHLAFIRDETGKSMRTVAICEDITDRKNAEYERNSLQITLENSLNEIYIFDDVTFKFLFVNKGALHNIGYSENEVKTLTPLDLKPDFTLASFRKLVRPLIDNEKKKIIFFTLHKRKDGSLYPVEIHLQLVSVGNKKRFVAIILDITERKQAEEEVLSAYKEKNNILERITEAFVSLDVNWCYTYMNKKAGEIFNRDPEKMIGKHIWSEFPEGLNQPFHLAYEKAMATQEYIHVEEHYKPYDMWFENHIYPSRDGLSIFFRDVSARKRIEEQLRQSNERFERVTEATKDAIWDWDIVNKTFYRSQAFERFFGNEAVGLFPDTDLWSRERFHPDDFAKIQSTLTEAIENPTSFHGEMEYRLLQKDGKIIYVINRAIIIRNNEGKAIRMVGAMTDITGQKQMTIQLSELNQSLKQHAAELERSNEELEQFAFVTSHDLQEPLRMISSFMDQLKRKYEDQLDEKALHYIHYATDGAKRMKQIILDLLEYSRANSPSEKSDEVDLNLIVSDFRLLRRKTIAECKASIVVGNLPVLNTYKALVTQIFHSLIDNAIKYGKEGIPPIIEIGSREKDNEWEFFIKDNGIGIDPEFFDKIFLIFQRLHNRELYEGTGIGLSVVKRSVEFLGGRVWLDSAIGVGSVFYFTLAK